METAMENDSYQRLAQVLDTIPNGYPSTDSGVELRILQKLFTPEEAELATHLHLTWETAEQIANRAGRDRLDTYKLLKHMAKKRIIYAGRIDRGLGFGLMPFAFGFYELQMDDFDEEMAHLFEEYFPSIGRELTIEPQLHRILPVNETVRNDMEIRPFESVSQILSESNSFGVLDCICRKQKAFVGDPCDHPLDVCMVMSKIPHFWENSPPVKPLSRDEAEHTLQRAAEAGLVHNVANSQDGVWYVCNCCTCSCGVLRGLKELGIPNVVARSAFVNYVEEDLCTGCELCLDHCQFDALSMDGIVVVDEARCFGCGVCVLACPDDALVMVRREESEIKIPVQNEEQWRMTRAAARGIDFQDLM
jgi:Na+-translocating ferredoxin:NAD+ oxidoreductase RNF subunit RnfB